MCHKTEFTHLLEPTLTVAVKKKLCKNFTKKKNIHVSPGFTLKKVHYISSNGTKISQYFPVFFCLFFFFISFFSNNFCSLGYFLLNHHFPFFFCISIYGVVIIFGVFVYSLFLFATFFCFS